MTEEILDVAIVGGGVSGVYSGWRLLRDATPASRRQHIVVFEGGERVGGRLLSPVPPDMPATHVELGGMRYMSRHLLVSGLVKLFGFATTPMPVAEAENIAYLRGQQLRL